MFESVPERRLPPIRTSLWRGAAFVSCFIVVMAGLAEAWFAYRQSTAATSDALRAEASWAVSLVLEQQHRVRTRLREIARLPWGQDGFGTDQMVVELGRGQTADTDLAAGAFTRGGQIVIALEKGAIVRNASSVLSKLQAVSWPTSVQKYEPFCGRMLEADTGRYLPCRVDTSVHELSLVVAMNPRAVSESLSKINTVRDTQVFVVDAAGLVVAHSVPALVGGMVNLKHRSNTASRWLDTRTNLHGQDVLGAYELVPGTDWLVVAEYPESVALKTLPSIALRTAILLLLSLIVSVLAGRAMAAYQAKSIEKLAIAVAKISSGELSTRVDVGDSQEISLLASGISDMAEKLHASYSSLERKVEEKTRDLANANAALETVSQHKSDFLAHMSHELRTPLNAVIGFSEMLKAQYFGPLNDKQAEYVRDINASGQHLLSLINDILDLAKVEAGRMELARSDVHLPSVVEACCSLVSERFARKSQTLDAVVDPAVSFWSLDERKVKQCVLNLLSNANKFTPNGGRVSLSVAVEVGALVVRVTDTGVGIAPDAVSQLFTEFYQVAPSSAAAGGAAAAQSTEAREGTGLGLSLTKKFVELHGGTVEVASEVGNGSTFTLRFPAVATADAETAVLS